MTASIEYLSNTASVGEIAEHLSNCDADFEPPLSSRVRLGGYAKKIAAQSTRFEAWSGSKLVGLLAIYCNETGKCVAYITNVSVLRRHARNGIANCLVSRAVKYAKESGMSQIRLEVALENVRAISLYGKNGFVLCGENRSPMTMALFFNIAKQ